LEYAQPSIVALDVEEGEVTEACHPDITSDLEYA
jgi:hypothetical protein